MNPEAIRIINRLKTACVQPKNETQSETALAWELILECCIVEKLTAAELERGYRTRVRKKDCYRPRYGEWLEDCRPSASVATVSGEAETIFQSLIDQPSLYGKYNPNGPRVYERRRVAATHGAAAGIAFAAVASRFRNLEEESVPYVRRDFVTAYEDARKDQPAPLTLDPARLLPSPPGAAGRIPGSVGPEEAGEQEQKFRELVRGFREPAAGPRVDVEARLAQLRKQAEEIGGAA